MSLLSACFVVIFTLFVDVILAVHLSDVYGIPSNIMGIYFLLAAITYVIGAPLSSYLSRIINRRYLVMIAFSLIIVQAVLEGPS